MTDVSHSNSYDTEILPAEVVQSLYRIFRLALVHDLQNEALHRSIASAVEIFRAHTIDAPEGGTVDFLDDTVLVDGYLLRASRAQYENAIDLGKRMQAAGFNRVVFSHELESADVTAAVAEFLSRSLRSSRPPGAAPMVDRFLLKHSDAAIHLGGESELVVNRVMSQTYAYAVVIMQRLLKDVLRRRYMLSRHVKRICQRLVMLADMDQAAFTGLASMAHSFHDAASRAVSGAVIAVSMARMVTRDLRTLSRVAMSAMLFEVGLPRALDLEAKRRHEHMEETVDPHTRVPTSSALITAALGRLRDDAVARAVVAFEAQWLHRAERLGPLYDNLVAPRFESALVNTVWRYHNLISGAEGTRYRRDHALLIMSRRALTEVDTQLTAMLMATVGIYPAGTVVELTSGWKGVVARSHEHPAAFRRPIVHLVIDPANQARKVVRVNLIEPSEFGEIGRAIESPDPALLATRDWVLEQVYEELGWE